jgi:formate dehydrogenase iron-sulfur subunit
MASFSEWNEVEGRRIIEGLERGPGALLPMLHALNDTFGYIPDAGVPMVARALNLSRAEVHGTLTFYHDFRKTPPGRHVIKLCRAEACQARGSRALEAHAKAAGASVDPVYCLGNCANGPSLLVDGRLHAEVDAARFDTICQTLDAPDPDEVQAGSGTRAYVPGDATAVALGADDVARALSKAGLSVVRTGSRGAFWLEPLVEFDTPEGRIAYAGVRPEDLPLQVGHAKCIGNPLRHQWFQGQTRLTMGRSGVVDPTSCRDHEAQGGLQGLRRALGMTGDGIVAEVEASGLRGRGGAGFPAGRKWRTVLTAPTGVRYIVCNADEGDSGTFADRLLMEGDPFMLIEGMAIAGVALGAEQGYIYLRSEYPQAAKTLRQALEDARRSGLLGDVLGSGKRFDITLRMGAGSYICGEETAMLESLEGKRGQVRAKPPLPAIQGLFGRPTLVHNVLSLAAIPTILADGGAAYASHGVGRSRGTLTVQLAGNVKRGGLIEVPFGMTLREIIEGFGGGTNSGRPIRAVQVGGPLGSYLPVSLLDVPLDYEALAEMQGLLGHGGVVVFDDTVNMAEQARFAFEFCALESCGKCTPCRIGSTRGAETIDRLLAGDEAARSLLDELCETLTDASLCALGGLTPLPVLSALRHFPEDFRVREEAHAGIQRG